MLKETYQGRIVFITGHTGFVGSWLCASLLEAGAKITGFSDGIPTDPSMFLALGLGEKIESDLRGDVRDLDAIANAILKVRPDFIFHLAAQPIVGRSYSEPIETILSNTMGTVHVLEALRQADFSCTGVMVTTDKVYRNEEKDKGYSEEDPLGGHDPYSASKAAAEILISSYAKSFFAEADSRIRVSPVRAGNIIGGGDWGEKRLVPDCIRSWQAGEAVEIRNPVYIRPWQHVLEAVYSYLLLGSELASRVELKGEAFNFGPPELPEVPVLDLVKFLSQAWKEEGTGGEFTFDRKKSFKETRTLKLNSQKAAELLNWKPQLSIETAAGLAACWYQNFYQGKQDAYSFTQNQIRSFGQ